jgi:succinate dehydrogenase / fumarate reductase cytochrome b subunit
MLSILHRACGVALAAGLGFITWMLVAAASGPEQFALVVDLGSSPLGLLMLFGWSFALMYHMCNGIRHLIWDTGHVFEINQATRAGYAVLAAAVILTTLIWAFALTN